MKSTFRMMEFRPNENWKWVGRFLWLTVYYDHRFVPLSATQTKLVWIVAAEGFGAAIFGRLFAKVYRKNLERAIPLLISEMTAARPIVQPDTQIQTKESACQETTIQTAGGLSTTLTLADYGTVARQPGAIRFLNEYDW